ncbi:MAG TPA: VOC family protein [Chthoniobacteraceae bacterium]|jgi:predicted 3-demethylubiquinone-9 3-methyltransferase (glyoxalase superfamily)|nr:VOC family protein [Chthoniobacteraceae bacterium]
MKIIPFLWFDDQAEEAANFYIGIFKNSRITALSRYPAVGQDIHGKPAGSVMVVEFELDGRRFTALNGGPAFKFTEAISFEIECATQEEIDYYWDRLSDGGPGQCGWLKDKYGLSWQVGPANLKQWLTSEDKAAAERAFAAMLTMGKLDMGALERAFRG